MMLNNRIISDNRSIMLTRANAKALAISTSNSYGGLDGYIQLNSSSSWSYDFLRQNSLGSSQYDFLSVAMHEIGHAFGFVSGVDSFQTVTPLDLFRYSSNSTKKGVIDFSVGSSSYFSLNKGTTNLGNFATGTDGYQASHWQQSSSNSGKMFAAEIVAGQRANVSSSDLTALDAIGWNVNYQALPNLTTLYQQATTKAGSANIINRSADVQRMKDDSEVYNWGTTAVCNPLNGVCTTCTDNNRNGICDSQEKFWQQGQKVPESGSTLALIGMGLWGLILKVKSHSFKSQKNNPSC